MDDAVTEGPWPDESRIIRLIGARYTIGLVTALRPLRIYTNAVYELTTDAGRYALKLYRPGWRTEREIRWEIDLLDHLADCGICVAPAIRDRDVTAVHRLGAGPAAPLAVVFAWADGVKPDPPFPLEPYEREGRAVAALHTALDRYQSRHQRAALDLTTLIDRPLSRVVPLVADAVSRRTLVGTAARLRERLTELASLGLDRGPCHGDVSFDNLHLTDAGKFVWYDFDSGGPGWRAIDLQGWSAFDPARRPLGDAFLAGYRAVRPLGGADVAAAPLLTLAQDIWGLSVDVRYRVAPRGPDALGEHFATTITQLADRLREFV